MILVLFATIVFGIYLMVKGSDLLVDGAVSIAQKFSISPLIIGLTIVAFGTSAPEFVVSVNSSLQGQGSIAIGNVLGSNIANLLLILGICALLRPLVLKSSTVWKEIPLALAGAFAVLLLAFGDYFRHTVVGSLGASNEVVGQLSIAEGLILLIFFWSIYVLLVWCCYERQTAYIRRNCPNQ